MKKCRRESSLSCGGYSYFTWYSRYG